VKQEELWDVIGVNIPQAQFRANILQLSFSTGIYQKKYILKKNFKSPIFPYFHNVRTASKVFTNSEMRNYRTLSRVNIPQAQFPANILQLTFLQAYIRKSIFFKRNFKSPILPHFHKE